MAIRLPSHAGDSEAEMDVNIAELDDISAAKRMWAKYVEGLGETPS
jgi:hypothetical protein